MAAQRNQVNAAAHEHKDAKVASASAAAAAASPVWVSDQFFGAAVTTVNVSGSGSEKMYWMNLSNGTALTTVDFIVTYKPGSPLNEEHQSFSFPGSGYAGSISTPFGVPAWGGNLTAGPAVLTVLANGVSVGSYKFNVV